ncbi:hypothetical protein B0J13DRAFT_20221 [Dactylonectria estremocensis]|uniref:Uncharacterized protein n=1 Tax=Dactylonectria estremocensis TaxID=1079267 RepID=A0A9P9FIE9_9HYPO|nr:hypothetical protein B0J13DRAFT_20221 [Dactylonectria estremocensis]
MSDEASWALDELGSLTAASGSHASPRFSASLPGCFLASSPVASRISHESVGSLAPSFLGSQRRRLRGGHFLKRQLKASRDGPTRCHPSASRRRCYPHRLGQGLSPPPSLARSLCRRVTVAHLSRLPGAYRVGNVVEGPIMTLSRVGAGETNISIASGFPLPPRSLLHVRSLALHSRRPICRNRDKNRDTQISFLFTLPPSFALMASILVRFSLTGEGSNRPS